VGHLADHQVGLIGRGAGNQHIGIPRAGLLEHRGLYTVANHAAQIKPFLEEA